MYRLYLDLQLAQLPVYRERGSVRYTVEHAAALVGKPGLVTAVGLDPLAPFPKNLDARLASFPGLQWATAANFKRAASNGDLAYFMMSPFAPSHPEHLLSSRPNSTIPMIVNLVDLTPLISDDPLFKRRDVAVRYRSRFDLVEQADLILTISENTKRLATELLHVDPSRVTNIGTGVSAHFKPDPHGGQPRRLISSKLPAVRRPFVLSVTGVWDWKNTDRLIEAFSLLPAELRSSLQLVVVCSLTEKYRQRWTKHAQRHGLSQDELVLTDLVSEEMLTALLQTAELFVYPSLYEGFGLPAAEAAACGCPTIVSNTSSMPEILDHPPATFDPYDTTSIASLIERSLSDREFNRELHNVAARARRRHTWARVAEKTERALAILDRPLDSGREPTLRPSIAWAIDFSANKPETTNRTISLILQTARVSQLDVLHVGDIDFAASLHSAGGRSFPLGALGRRLSPVSYDAIIFTVSLEGTHGDIRDKGVRYPGLVWIPEYEASDYGPNFGHGPAPHMELIRAARGVITTSKIQARLLSLDLGPGARLPPFLILPDGERDIRTRARHIVDFVAGLSR